uniref:Ribosomal protein L16 n=1 Tax=Melanthalia intermedia TaxID=172989 RepID=A0A345UBN4_9FLOR|nr:ribosomal protein L16 [Melanthalia intermedia]AXI97870.1 ribosomal protein L16 [Melanthalia intermedia]
MLKIKKTHNKYPFKRKQSNHTLKYGLFGLKASSFGRLTENQFNVLHWAIIRKLKKITNNNNFRFWNFLLFNLTLTKFNLESRMGKGKGAIYTRAIYIRPGTVLFEFDGLQEQQMLQLFNYITKQIPLKVIFIKRFLR